MFISDESFTDIIDSFIDNEYCPDGKQVDGCPVNEIGVPLSCDECWELWFSDYIFEGN